MSNFDPMTGQPVSETTENVVENTVIEAGAAETTVVEENVAEKTVTLEKKSYVEEDRIIGYDPMTGEPIRESAQQAQPQMNFDPMTGQPVVPGASVNGVASNDTKMKNGSKNAPIIIGAIAVVVILVVVAIFSGLFSSKATKVMTAVANTFKDTPKMVEAFKGFDVMLEDAYTVNMELEVEGDYIEVQYSAKKGEKQVSGAIDIDDVPEMEFLAGITSSEVKLQVPDITDYVFVYNYKEDKDGYLADEMGDDAIEAIDMLCEMVYSQKQQSDASKELTKIVMDAVKDLEFESVDKEEYKVGGKKRSCKGYKVEVTEDLFLDIIDAMEESIDPEYIEMMEELDVDVTEVYDDLRDEVDDLDDLELTFYIYKNKLACLLIEIDKQEMEIMFKDCEKGMHDIEICLEGKTVMEIEGSVDGSSEVYEVEVGGKEFLVAEYDTKSGDYEIEATENSYTMAIRGNLESTSKGASFSIDELEEYGRTEDMSIVVAVEKGASMEKFDGDEIDIGNVTEDDLMEVVMELYSAID